MKTLTHGLLAVGKIVKAFGIQGDLVVRPMTDSPDRFRRLRVAYVGSDATQVEERTLERVMVESRGVRIKLTGVSDRTAAERFVGRFLFIEEQKRARLPKGRYYVHDLIGMSVVDEVRGTIGELRDVLKMPAQDVYVVDDHGKEIMIPAVKEFIRKVDLSARQMTVHLIEGMADESAGEVA